MNKIQVQTTARAADLDTLLEKTVPLFIEPVPSRSTLRDWLDRAGVPRFKANPTAKRGGGAVYYQVAGVEKLLRRMTGKMEQEAA